jgi:hypothetical protein
VVTHFTKSPVAGTVEPGLIVQLAVMAEPAPIVQVNPVASLTETLDAAPPPTPKCPLPGVEIVPPDDRVAVELGLKTWVLLYADRMAPLVALPK